MKLQALLFLSLALASCGAADDTAGTSGGAAAAPDAPKADLAAGSAFFAQTCIPCHGAGGQGDGAASASLDPKPRDLTDSAWQESVDDEYIRKIIQYGGGAVGKAITMPANPVLGSQPETLAGLVLHVRSLGK